MARNWDMAARGGLGQIVDAYYAGKDRKNALEDRDRAWGQTTLKNQQEQAQHDPYNKIKLDANGNPAGLEENLEYQKRDQNPSATRFPEFFHKENTLPRPAAPTAPAPAAGAQPAPGPMQDMTAPDQAKSPTGRPMGKTDYPEANGDRAPNGMQTGDPEPLLGDPGAVQAEAQMKSNERMAHGKMQLEEKKLNSGTRAYLAPGSTGAVEYDKNDPGHAGVDPVTGKPVHIRNATKTAQSFDQGVDEKFPVAGNASDSSAQGAAPLQHAAQGDNSQDYNPTPYMRKRITDMATTSPKLAMSGPISLAGLPPALQKRLGIDPNTTATMDRDLLGRWMAGEFGLSGKEVSAKGKEGIPEDAAPYLTSIDSGHLSPGQASEAYQADHPGQPIPKALTDAFYKSSAVHGRTAGQQGINDRFGQTMGQKDRSAYTSMVGKASDQWKKMADEILSETQYAKNAKNMANSGDTVGMVGAIRNMLARASAEKGPLSVYDVKQFGGAEGWAETAEQFLAKGSNEGMTPENVKIVNRLADIYIKAANNKAKSVSRPIIGGLRARAHSYGLNPDDAEDLFRSEMDLEIGAGDDGTGQPAFTDTAPLPGASVAAKAPADSNKLKSQYQAALKAIDASPANASQKRIAKQKATEFYKSKGGK